MYPYSTSLRSLPVPGIGFCHSIAIDDHERDLTDYQNRKHSRDVSADRPPSSPLSDLRWPAD
jgi:hypothetical protein